MTQKIENQKNFPNKYLRTCVEVTKIEIENLANCFLEVTENCGNTFQDKKEGIKSFNT